MPAHKGVAPCTPSLSSTGLRGLTLTLLTRRASELGGMHTGVRRGNPQLPSLGVHLQFLMSPVLRESLGMVEGKHTGVMCARADFGSAAYGTLLPGDVLLEVDGQKVANDGSINLYGRRLQLICTSITITPDRTHPSQTPLVLSSKLKDESTL